MRNHLVWTPIYKRFVVTASADYFDAFGYADFALGHFGRDDDVGQPVIGVIKRDWKMQEGLETLLRAGLVKAAIEMLAEQVWPLDDDEEDHDENNGATLQLSVLLSPPRTHHLRISRRSQ
jgi:hypothetical protein